MSERAIELPHGAEPSPGSPEELDTDILGRLTRPLARIIVVILGLLTIAGIVGVVLKGSAVPAQRSQWGYYAAMVGFLISTAQAAPILAWMTRMARGHWARALRRPAELCAVAGIVSSILFIRLPGLLPPLDGRQSIWFTWRLGAPGVWDSLAVYFLAFLGLALLYTGALPDFASAQQRTTGRRNRLYGRLALGWQGSIREWRMLHLALVMLGIFYTLLFALVQLLYSVDFQMSLIPGRNSSLFPAYYFITSLQGGVAVVTLAVAGWRWLAGMRRYFPLDLFWSLGRILLVLSLFWMYFWWGDFLTLWYGRMPHEQATLRLLISGPYLTLFILTFMMSFVIPFLSLVITRVRRSMVGPTLLATSILIGLLLDRVRLLVSAFSFDDPTGHMSFERMPAALVPGTADVLMMVGALAACVLLYVLATRVVPSLSLWEVKEGLFLHSTRRFLRTRLPVIGKPR